jgi:hypothetical protein
MGPSPYPVQRATARTAGLGTLSFPATSYAVTRYHRATPLGAWTLADVLAVVVKSVKEPSRPVLLRYTRYPATPLPLSVEPVHVRLTLLLATLALSFVGVLGGWVSGAGVVALTTAEGAESPLPLVATTR